MRVLLLLLLAAGLCAQPSRMKVILDTDIGTDIDDAWALAFAARHPGFDLLGVTVTDGDTAARARVACKLLQAAGRPEVPVAVGRATAVEPDHVNYQFAWAEDFTAVKPTATPAARFLVEAIRRHPGEVTLLAVGPLQNVADALRLDPGIRTLVKRVVLMSGNVYSSAWQKTPMAEWNVKLAIPDAQLAYSAGWPLAIVPLDATTHVVLQEAERARIRKAGTLLSTALEVLYRLWLESPASRMTLHDQLAVAEVARPGALFGKQETLPILVDAEGFTRIDPARGKPTVVCLEPKRDAFMELYLSTLTR